MKKVSILAASLALLSPMPSAAVAAAPKPVGMANPASVHCGEIGGRLMIRKDRAGNKCIGPKAAMRGK